MGPGEVLIVFCVVAFVLVKVVPKLRKKADGSLKKD